MYCHVSGVCVTNNNGFWIWRSNLLDVYTIWLQQFTNHCWLDTGIFWPHHSSNPTDFTTLPPLSESELLYDWQFTASQFVLVTSPLRLTTSNFIFQPSTCGYSPYVTSSLTRGWVSRLQLLLVLASVVILRSESRGTHDHNLLSQTRDSHNL
jgi:hypothetical protein